MKLFFTIVYIWIITLSLMFHDHPFSGITPYRSMNIEALPLLFKPDVLGN